MAERQPSFERGCQGKTNLGSKAYKKSADKFAKKHGKIYSVYQCPHCRGTHLTTKPVDNSYAPILYTTTTQEDSND